MDVDVFVVVVIVVGSLFGVGAIGVILLITYCLYLASRVSRALGSVSDVLISAYPTRLDVNLVEQALKARIDDLEATTQAQIGKTDDYLHDSVHKMNGALQEILNRMRLQDAMEERKRMAEAKVEPAGG